MKSPQATYNSQNTNSMSSILTNLELETDLHISYPSINDFLAELEKREPRRGWIKKFLRPLTFFTTFVLSWSWISSSISSVSSIEPAIHMRALALGPRHNVESCFITSSPTIRHRTSTCRSRCFREIGKCNAKCVVEINYNTLGTRACTASDL